MSLLGEDSWQQSHNGPTQEAPVSGDVAAVEECVLLLGVAVQVAVNPQFAALVTHQLLHLVNLRVKLFVRTHPLPIQVQP